MAKPTHVRLSNETDHLFNFEVRHPETNARKVIRLGAAIDRGKTLAGSDELYQPQPDQVVEAWMVEAAKRYPGFQRALANRQITSRLA